VTIAILSVLAAALGLFAAGLAWSHARRVARLTSGTTRSLATALKRVPEASRVSELERRAPPASFEHAIAIELRCAPDDAAKIAAVNDALLEAEHTLRQGATWPRAGIRIALAGGLLLGLSAWLATGNLRAAVILVAVGGAAALLCVEAGRSAKRHTEAQRADIDALITVVMGDLADQAAPPGERRGNAGHLGRRPTRRRRPS
jgi:Flp pilus assembly protein TadB